MTTSTKALRGRFAAAAVGAAKLDSTAAASKERCFTELRHNFHSL